MLQQIEMSIILMTMSSWPICNYSGNLRITSEAFNGAGDIIVQVYAATHKPSFVLTFPRSMCQYCDRREKIINSIEIPILTRCCFCFPLRKGLIVFAYANLILTIVVTALLSMYISYIRNMEISDMSEYPRLITDTTALVLEIAMSITFVVALHKKHVLLMKVYLYFEIVFSIIGLVYSLAFLTRETASELFLILFQLMLQIYLVILIWSSIVKMERDGTVKYTRERDPV